MRTRLHEIVSRPGQGDFVSRLYDLFIVVVALCSIAPALFHANSLGGPAQSLLSTIDIATAYILLFDYLLRWMTYDIETGKRGRVREFLKYPFTFAAIVDLLSILPTMNILPSGFLFLRALRIVRLFRYSRQLAVIVNVFVQERKTLGSVLMLAIAYILATALVMFTFEPSTFNDFVDAIYWATITLTTVGFGDIHPNSDLGHILTSISSIFAVFIFALPAGIMTGGFLQQLRQKEEEGEDYYNEPLFAQLKANLSRLRPSRVKEHLETHPKVVLYARFMLAGIALDFLLCLFFSELFAQPIWLDTAGTAIVACMLDPAAAVIVSFANNLLIAIYHNSPQSILYFAESALVALVYGFMFKRAEDGSLPRKNTVKVLLVVVLVQTAISLLLAFWLSGGRFTSVYENAYRDFLVGYGLDYYLASFLAMLFDRALDATGVFLLVKLAVLLANKRGFFPHEWLERRYAALGARPARAGAPAASAPAEKKTGAQAAPDGRHARPAHAARRDDEGILSAQDEALCLSRSGLRRIVLCLKRESRDARETDAELSDKLEAAAQSLELISRRGISSEEEFKELLRERL